MKSSLASSLIGKSKLDTDWLPVGDKEEGVEGDEEGGGGGKGEGESWGESEGSLGEGGISCEDIFF